MIKKTFIILLTGLSMLSYAQEPTGAESTASDKTKKEKKVKEKKEKAPKPEKPAKAPKPQKEAKDVGEFKPEAGDISIDFTANNLFKIGENSNQFGLSDDAQGFGGGIRARYFLFPEGAIRVNFTTDMRNYSGYPLVSDPADGVSEGDALGITHEQKYNHFSISLGYEYHFEGTDRLDTYAGGEFLYDKVTIEEEFKNGKPIAGAGGYEVDPGYYAKAKGGTVEGNKEIDLSRPSEVWDAAGTGIGLRVMAGADFYVFQKVYIGAELGFALMQKHIADFEFTESTGNVYKTTNRGKSFNMGQDVTGQFRVGFRL